MGRQMQEILERDKNLKLERQSKKDNTDKNKKTLSLTDQDKRKEHNKMFNDIIPPGTNIDNGELYFERDGHTFKDLLQGYI